MRFLDLFGFRDSGAEVSTSNDATASGSIVVQFQQPSVADDWQRQADLAADLAMEWGLKGAFVTCEYAAALADAYAQLAEVARWAEEQRDTLAEKRMSANKSSAFGERAAEGGQP